MLQLDMLNSEGYIALKPSSAKALPYFMAKNKVPPGDAARLTFEFSLSYAEGNKYGFSSSTFSKIIQDVIEKGFIDPVDKGGLRGHGKSCSVFRLSDRWKSFGTPVFQGVNWKSFKPKEHFKKGTG